MLRGGRLERGETPRFRDTVAAWRSNCANIGNLFAGYVGLVVVMPWLGHASWHAYRDLALKPRDAGEAQAA